jgi:hypothetical protein
VMLKLAFFFQFSFSDSAHLLLYFKTVFNRELKLEIFHYLL